MVLDRIHIMKKLFCSILVFFNFSSLVFAIEKTPYAVDEYSKLLQKFRSDKALSIEQTFEKGTDAILALADALGYDESELDPKWLKSVREKMEGFDINPNTETFVASPKLEFFLALVKMRDNPQDIAFFELFLKTKPDGNWPIYIQQETDLSGCTVYDGTLSKLHQGWSEFQKKYPKSFVKMSRDFLGNIEQHLNENHCSCTKMAEPILKELQNFIQINPKLPITLKIIKRVKELSSKKLPNSGCKN